MMSLALVLAAGTVAFATAQNRHERKAPVHAIPPSAPEPTARTVDEPEDYSQPWLDIPDPKPVPQQKLRQNHKPKSKPEPESASKPEPRLEAVRPRLEPEAKPASKPGPKPETQDQPADAKQLRAKEIVRKASRVRRYDLPAWAKMGLTIPALGIHDAPVRSSVSQAALDAGVIHLPETSLPWDEGPRKNVYLAGHRLGWPGTGSWHIFYRLPELRRGDVVVLKGPRGRAYRYRVTEKLLVGPESRWVTKTAPGNDMLSLQTCTPIPTFQRRLIVRAERVMPSHANTGHHG